MLKWTFYGPDREIQLRIGSNTDYCLIALAFALNIATICKIIQLGRRMSSVSTLSTEMQKRARERFWREVRLSVSFAVITFTWTGHVTLFVVVEKQLGATAPWTGLISETFRCLLYLIDPLVYLFLTAELRSACLKVVGAG